MAEIEDTEITLWPGTPDAFQVPLQQARQDAANCRSGVGGGPCYLCRMKRDAIAALEMADDFDITVDRFPATPSTPEYVEVDVRFTEGCHVGIHKVYGYGPVGGQPLGQVSWETFNQAICPLDALAYAAAIRKAAEIAATLSGPVQ